MTTTDARGKTIRVGDLVHKLSSKREILKGRPNGSVLPADLGPRTVKKIRADGGVYLRLAMNNPIDGSVLVKE